MPFKHRMRNYSGRPINQLVGITNHGVSEFAAGISGQTLLQSEWFAEDRTAGSPGAFTSVSGTFVGGMTRGPKTAIQQTRRCGGMRWWTNAENGANTLMARGAMAVDNAGSPRNVAFGGWFCFAPRGIATYRAVMVFAHDASIPYGAGWSLLSATDTTFKLGFGFCNATEGDNSLGETTIQAMQWIYLGLSAQVGAANYQVKGFYKTISGSTTLLGDSNLVAHVFDANERMVVQQQIRNGQGGPAGLIASIRLYQVTDLATGLIYPAELSAPVQSRKTYVVNASTGNNSNVEGPWLNDTGISNGLRSCAIMGGNPAWKDSAGNSAIASTLTTNALAIAWRDAFRADRGAYIPQGDIVQYSEQDHFLTVAAGLNFEHQVPGITVRMDGTSGYIYGNVALPTTGWTDLGGGAWRLTGSYVVGGGLWAAGTPNADGTINLIPLAPVREATEADAHTAVKANNYHYWANDPTTTGIVVRVTGSDVNGTQFYYSAMSVANDGDGLPFVIGDGLRQNLRVAGGRSHLAGDLGGIQRNYPFAVLADITTRAMIAVDDRCKAKHFGKHAYAFVKGPSPGLNPQHLIYSVECESMAGPVAESPTHGYQGAEWTAFVDFSATDTQAANGTGPRVFRDDCVDDLNLEVAGTSTPIRDETKQSYIIHTNGGVNQFAYVSLDDNNWRTVTFPGYLDAGGAVQKAFPAWPENVVAADTGQTTMNVSWDAVTSATSYEVHRATSSGGTFSKVGSPSASPFGDTGLTANTAYYYKIKAVTEGTAKGFSAEATDTTDP